MEDHSCVEKGKKQVTHLSDVVNIDLLDEMVQNKYVKIQTHPEFPEYSIANYTDSCMWDQVWNEATLNCRGLIFNSKTLQVMERPFSKFFNYEQEQAPKWGLSTKVHVTDKMDGSLGILYWRPDGKPAIATRGSFDSDQARWATDFYQRVYWNNWYPNANFTYLFEIIYPENRIVINYGDTTDLVLLGAVDTATGQSIPPDVAASEAEWVGSHAPIYWQDTTLENVISQPPRAGMEGFVLWNRDTDERVKIKYDEYKMLHRYLTNTTPKHVWEVLSTEQDPNEIFASAPDEFHVWLK